MDVFRAGSIEQQQLTWLRPSTAPALHSSLSHCMEHSGWGLQCGFFFFSHFTSLSSLLVNIALLRGGESVTSIFYLVSCVSALSIFNIPRLLPLP